MAARNIHYWGRGTERYGPEYLIEGIIPTKELKMLYALQASDEEALDKALDDLDDYYVMSAILEDLDEEDFMKVVDGESGFVWAEEMWFGIGGNKTKAKVGFAEEDCA